MRFSGGGLGAGLGGGFGVAQRFQRCDKVLKADAALAAEAVCPLTGHHVALAPAHEFLSSRGVHVGEIQQDRQGTHYFEMRIWKETGLS
jgi:hypothetical protein